LRRFARGDEQFIEATDKAGILTGLKDYPAS